MRGFLTLSLMAAAAAIPAVANAAVVIVDASSIQGANVLFNAGTQTGTTVTGATQGGTIVNFTGLTVGGGTMISANGGQARVEGINSLNLAGVTFGLAGGQTFTNVEFNLFNGGTNALATFNILGSSGTTYTFTNNAIANGSNMFGFIGTQGEVISQVSYTVSGGGFVDQRQLRLDQQAPGGGAVPEPATWLSMIMGMGLTAATMRRTKQNGKRLALARS